MPSAFFYHLILYRIIYYFYLILSNPMIQSSKLRGSIQFTLNAEVYIVETLDLLRLLYSWGSQLLVDMHKAIVKTFSFVEVIQVIRGHQKAKHWICCCYCIPGVPSFCLICIKPQLKHFHFWRSFRSLEVLRGHQKVKHWICCCYWIPWAPSFCLICIKPQLKYFLFVEVILGHQRSLKLNLILLQEFRTLIRRASKKLEDLNQK